MLHYHQKEKKTLGLDPGLKLENPFFSQVQKQPLSWLLPGSPTCNELPFSWKQVGVEDTSKEENYLLYHIQKRVCKQCQRLNKNTVGNVTYVIFT